MPPSRTGSARANSATRRRASQRPPATPTTWRAVVAAAVGSGTTLVGPWSLSRPACTHANPRNRAQRANDSHLVRFEKTKSSGFRSVRCTLSTPRSPSQRAGGSYVSWSRNQQIARVRSRDATELSHRPSLRRGASTSNRIVFARIASPRSGSLASSGNAGLSATAPSRRSSRPTSTHIERVCSNGDGAPPSSSPRSVLRSAGGANSRASRSTSSLCPVAL